tara:strand:+ start:496 stop:1428 length:933 start_codon:yes stop_codon:yes gene_type:complete
MNIALTGSSGFIGSNLANFLEDINSINVIFINRSLKNNDSKENEFTLDEFFNNKILLNIDLIIHLASPNFDYENESHLNDGIVKLTKNILFKAPSYNCKNFIYFSSCKIYGESSYKNQIYNENSRSNALTDYAKAKLEAEFFVNEICKNLNINFTIYRLPFVYGKGMSSNLAKITKALDKSIPFFIFSNNLNLKKSFLSIKNIELALKKNINDTSSISNEIFNLADSNSLSLSQFIESYKIKSNSRSIIIKLSPKFFYILGRIPFLGKLIIKVFGSFEVDNKKIQKMYGLKLFSSEEGISEYINDVKKLL